MFNGGYLGLTWSQGPTELGNSNLAIAQGTRIYAEEHVSIYLRSVRHGSLFEPATTNLLLLDESLVRNFLVFQPK
jgi:hypothetical protein